MAITLNLFFSEISHVTQELRVTTIQDFISGGDNSHIKENRSHKNFVRFGKTRG
jgi:hypothetical protein